MITAGKLRRLTLFGTPVALVVLFFMHTNIAFGEFETVSRSGKWVAIHFLILPFYALLALSIYLLTDGFSGLWPKISRGGALVFAVFFSAFEAANGIAGGLIMGCADALKCGSGDESQIFERYAPPYEAIRFAVDDLPSEALMVLLDKIGAAGLLLALVAAAVTLSRAGVSKIPLTMLIMSGAIILGRHAWFYGSLAMVLYLAGVWWTETGDWGTKKGAPEESSPSA